MRMPFGKFAGTDLTDLPNDYLEWLGNLETLRNPLLDCVIAEWERRHGRRDPPRPLPHEGADPIFMLDIIESGYRKMAKEFHPDLGGNTQDMQRLNRAVAALRRLIKGV